jgi:hypothetical protein
VRARQTDALVSFRRWLRAVERRSAEIETIQEHLWDFATVDSDTFNAWYEAHPLTRLRSDRPLPQGVRDAAAAGGVDQERLRDAIHDLMSDCCGGLFGGIESEWSLRPLEAIPKLTAKDGVQPAPAEGFTDSLWIDDDWAKPTPEQVAAWRATG